MWNKYEMAEVFHRLKGSLRQIPRPGGPKLAIVSPPYYFMPGREDLPSNEPQPSLVYLELSADLDHASFGTLQTNNLLEGLDVNWIVRERSWDHTVTALRKYWGVLTGNDDDE